MLQIKTLLILLTISSVVFSQKIGSWKNYTDVKNVTDVKVYEDGFWMTSTGGAGNYLNQFSDYTQFLTKSDGLNSQNLTALSIDNENQVWFGMQNGIIDIYNQENGSMNEILDIFQSNHTKKNINNILISGDTSFVSTEFGLSLIDTKGFGFIATITKLGNFPSTQRVNSASVIGGKIYVSTENGVAVQKDGATNLIAPESWISYDCGSEIPAGETYSTVLFDGKIITSTNVGLVQFDGAIWTHYAYDTRVFDTQVNDNKLYTLFSNSLHTFDGANDVELYASDTNEFHKFDLVGEELLIATDLGVIKTAQDSFRTIIPNGPINNSFQNLAVDKNGTLWVGTGNDRGGVGFMKFDGSLWTNYNKVTYPELPNNNYHNVSADDYQVYLSNWGAGLTTEEDGNFEFYNVHNSELIGIPSDPNYIVIMNAARDSNHDLWFFNFASADEKPIIQLTTDSVWYHYRFPFFQLSEDVFITDGIIDQYNTKWFNVSNRGLFYFNENSTPSNETDDSWGWLKETDGLNSTDIRAFAIDERGELWLGTPKGANIISNPSSPRSSISNAYAIRQQSVTSIAVDPLNNKWIGTYQGIFVVSPDGIHLLEQYDSKNSPLPSDEILSISIDKNSGTVYIGTSFGLSTLTTQFIKPNQNYDKLFVYPNPFVVGENVELSIDGLVSNSSLKILSISGDVVRDVITPGGRLAFWDGRNDNGDFVASGIYLIVAYDEEVDNIATAKVAVIRK
ncbi:MAG: two-component regulator propeller domain-containing protein [Bacteroidota bacterium]